MYKLKNGGHRIYVQHRVGRTKGSMPVTFHDKR